MNLQQRLESGLQQLQLELDQYQQQKLLQYLHLLEKWNKHFNLTAVREIEKMLPVHLLDSLSIAPFIQAKSILDVGTGAGLPGIPLAICFPHINMTLLDSNGKKIRFCRQAIAELGLNNVTAKQQRIETFSNQTEFGQITSRAFSSLPNMLEWLDTLLSSSNELLAMKGQLPVGEIQQITSLGYQVSHERLDVPFVDGERHLVRIRRKSKD